MTEQTDAEFLHNLADKQSAGTATKLRDVADRLARYDNAFKGMWLGDDGSPSGELCVWIDISEEIGRPHFAVAGPSEFDVEPKFWRAIAAVLSTETPEGF